MCCVLPTPVSLLSVPLSGPPPIRSHSVHSCLGKHADPSRAFDSSSFRSFLFIPIRTFTSTWSRSLSKLLPRNCWSSEAPAEWVCSPKRRPVLFVSLPVLSSEFQSSVLTHVYIISYRLSSLQASSCSWLGRYKSEVLPVFSHTISYRKGRECFNNGSLNCSTFFLLIHHSRRGKPELTETNKSDFVAPQGWVQKVRIKLSPLAFVSIPARSAILTLINNLFPWLGQLGARRFLGP